jgi:glycosyltransferase involved in cell wall biosynthesis
MSSIVTAKSLADARGSDRSRDRDGANSGKGTSPRRVLHVFGGMDRGGAETMAMNLYRQIDRSRMQFDFAVQTDRACHYDAEIESLGGRILRLPVPAQSGWRAYAEAFHRTVGARGPFDAVHSHVHHFSGFVLHLSRRRGIPVRISHSHSNGGGTRASLGRQAYERSMQFLIGRSATHLLGCSRQACEALFGAACWSDGRVQVTPNAIPLADYAVCAESRDLLRQELRIAPSTPLIGHVGSFTEPKNHAFTVEVFRELSRALPDAHFVLVGDGALRPKIEESIRDAGLAARVHLLGIRGDVPRIMGALDLLLLPSRWEGLPVVLVEAQAAGVPCLVSDAVTRDADLATGLLRFASLQSGAAAWAGECLAHLQCVRPPRLERERALRRAGYDIADAARRLAGIYTNRADSWIS